jgi:hypothetical protein
MECRKHDGKEKIREKRELQAKFSFEIEAHVVSERRIKQWMGVVTKSANKISY